MIELLGWLIVAVAMARMVWLAIHPHQLDATALVTKTSSVPVSSSDELRRGMTG